jgi:hypothetical protein
MSTTDSEHGASQNVSMEEKSLDTISNAPNHAAFDDFPEGGARAWTVVLGAAGLLFCTFGYTNAFGYDTPQNTWCILLTPI